MKAIVFYYLSLPAVLLLCASCGGLLAIMPAAQNAPAGAEAVPPPLPAEAHSVAGDASLEKTFDSGHWVTTPSDAEIMIIGITGRRANRGEAVKEALADAARKAALYHGVRAESASVLNQGSGNLDYFSDFDYSISPSNDHEAYIDALVFNEDEDVLEKNGVLIVRTRYSGKFDVPPYRSAVEDGVPVWVKNYTADIPGFLAGVGFSRNKGSLQKTHTASYETALVALLPQLSTRVSNEVVDVSGAKMTNSVTRSEGELVNVVILETWFDKKTNSVWTLIAAKAKN